MEMDCQLKNEYPWMSLRRMIIMELKFKIWNWKSDYTKIYKVKNLTFDDKSKPQTIFQSSGNDWIPIRIQT